MKLKNFPDRKWFYQVLTVAFIYFWAARLSLFLAFQTTNASPVWPPSGIAFALILMWGYRIWPGIMAGAFLSNVVVFLANNAAHLSSILTASFLIGIGHSLEGI